MGRKFEFQNNNLELDIAGNDFSVDTLNPALLDAVEAFSKKAINFDIDSEKSDSENVQMMCKFLAESIDGILGDDSTKKIFKNKPQVNFFDLMDVMDYMITEIKEFKEEKNRKYGKYSPNRIKKK